MSITVKEIAAIAGISRGTVDRALKNRPGINEKTKKIVLEIAEKYNYTPNLIGKALVFSGKTIRIDVIMNSIGNPFFDEMKRGIYAAEDEFKSYGIKVFMSEFKGYDANELLNILNSLPKSTENIILTPIFDSRVEEKIKELITSGIRIITISSVMQEENQNAYVGCDYLKSGKIAGRLVGLLSSGKANLFIATGSVQHIGHKQRVDGISGIIKEYPDIKLVGLAENQDDDDIAYCTMKTILHDHSEIDFVCITAGGVNGTLHAIRDCARDIKVCSFDDTPVTRDALHNGTILATVCQQPFEQGYQAIRAIFDMIVTKKSVEKYIYTELTVKIDQSL